jgi:hypothetical protein
MEPSMNLEPIRKEKIPRRNDKCPCGSGKKAKRCCLRKIELFARLPQHVREGIIAARILNGHLPIQTLPVPEAVAEAYAQVEASSEVQA